MPQEFHWPIHTSSPARSLRWQAVEILADLFPKPHNFNVSVGLGLRKARLEKELAEFDFLHRLNLGRPANLDELVCAGTLLISSCKGTLPATVLPVEEELLVNPQTFDLLHGWVRERLHGVQPEQDE